MAQHYDILILGSGPIGAATAYFLSQQTDKKIGLVTQDPTEDHGATYVYAGGSLRWLWDDKQKVEMTKRTADFFHERLKEGVNLLANEDHYLFIHRGKYVPSLNFSAKLAVNWFLEQAETKGVEVHREEKVSVVKDSDGGCTVTTDKDEYQADKVLLALGVANQQFMSGYELELEKRQIFVLDCEVGEDERSFPHVIMPIGDGMAYVFIKQFPYGWRFVVGQEDVVEASEEPGEDDYYQALLEAGLGKLMPFLAKAKLETILWGMDAGNKDLKVEEQGNLLAVNCGSAARSCVYIGETVAQRLLS